MVYMEKRLHACEQMLKYRFENRQWLIRALTHASALSDEAPFGYERLEFLGDGALDMIIGLMLFEQYPERDEGWLTRARAMLVNTDGLAQRAIDVGLDRLLILGKGDVLPSTFRVTYKDMGDGTLALVAAVGSMDDAGLAAARQGNGI